ncbi:MAG: bifunctional proline dehydrogenase/L-glutamate gamma-semialdehyde dehydrogenase PutA, partial [Paracoccaceae bacterium]
MARRLEDLRDTVRRNTYGDEAAALAELKRLAALTPEERAAIAAVGTTLVKGVRNAPGTGIMESFLAEYGLSTREGVALMCLAEALLRVPDSETIDDLIRDKIAPHDWGAHVGDSSSILVNASTWALMLTGRVLDEEPEGIVGALRALVRRMGEPVIRGAVGRAMKEMGAQFVLGEDIGSALKRGAANVARGYTYSFDMLGEAARTEADAERYQQAYSDAIAAIAAEAKSDDLRDNPSISVKLSALHPRFEYPQREVMLPELVARTLKLVQQAKAAKVGFNIDAEEADRLDLTLDVFEGVLTDASLEGWDGFGVVVQTYGQRAPFVIDWLHALAESLDRRIMVRLVKGAYWDTEVKRAQVLGLPGYPVFTRKANTDVSFIACARKLLDMRGRIFPQFATHNAHSIAAILEMAGSDRDTFEFQRLHGMGEALHRLVREADNTRCRIYAPVGAHRDLLAYLVRRLLENGANSSFVHQIVDKDVPAEQIAADPFEAEGAGTANPDLPLPADIFPERRNSRGWDITDPLVVAEIDRRGGGFRDGHVWQFAGDGLSGEVREIANPAVPGETVGQVREAAVEDAGAAVDRAVAAANGWGAVPVGERAAILGRIAALYEANAPELFMLAAREAGKTLLD